MNLMKADGQRYIECKRLSGDSETMTETFDEPNIMDDFDTYEDYVADQYQSGYVSNDEELYYSKEDFAKYKYQKLQKETFESFIDFIISEWERCKFDNYKLVLEYLEKAKNLYIEEVREKDKQIEELKVKILDLTQELNDFYRK